MAGLIECKTCGFDLTALPVQLRMDPKDGGVRNLTCPLCGSSVVLRVQAFGILVRGSGASTSFARWKLSGKDETSPIVKSGRLSLRFDSLGSIEPREVCYARVPAFADENGRLVVPHIPIRTEYFDVVDEVALRALLKHGPIGEIVGSQYQLKIPLRGIASPTAISVPLLTPEAGPPSKENAYRHVNLRIWPNLHLTEWRFYLLGAASSGPEGEALLRSRGLRSFVRVRGDDEWHGADSTQRDGTSIVHVLEGRPTWVAVEIVDPSRGDEPVLLGGGIFVIPEATEATTKEADVTIGLDFGTSNTCVAVDGQMTRSQAGPELLPAVPETEWNLYLLRGGAEATAPAGPDLWPPCRGFGSMRDLFPSELLFPGPKREMAAALPAIEQWRFGRDYGIPAAGVTPEYSEDEYTLGDFKWREMLRLRAPVFASHTPLLQGHYMAAVLMTCYVRAAIASGQAARTANVLYSYPMAFSGDDLSNIRQAAQFAATTLQRDTGLSWTLDAGADESTAAAKNVGDPGANIVVYLDMGGGSTDIGVKLEKRNNEWETVYLTSVAYAGSDLLASYVGKVEPNGAMPNSCLAGKTTLDVLRRRVRESTSAKEVLGDPTLFKKTFEAVIEKRTRHFYGYLTEYVARLLAAGFLDQRFRVESREGRRSYSEDAKIAFFFLGNGWRFASPSVQEVESLLAQQIFDRMVELVGAERSDYGKAIRRAMPKPDRIRHVVGAMDKRSGIPHPKAAVALGVLRGRGPGGASEGEPRSGILGWPTKVDASEVPWFARYSHAGAGGPCPPEERRALANSWGDEDEPDPKPAEAAGGASTCEACGATNAPGAKFCSGCGAAANTARPAQAFRFCSDCGVKSAPDAKFCSGCGATFGMQVGPTAVHASTAASPPTPWYKKISSDARLDWSPETMVLPESLRQPDRLDRDLNQTRPLLKNQCRPGPGEWFTKGAYEVTLEVLFKNKLGEIA